jgi:hypothetical protein
MDLDEDFTREGAMKLEMRGTSLCEKWSVQPPDMDMPALVLHEGELFTAADVDRLADAFHRLATNARGLNRGRFS